MLWPYDVWAFKADGLYGGVLGRRYAGAIKVLAVGVGAGDESACGGVWRASGAEVVATRGVMSLRAHLGKRCRCWGVCGVTGLSAVAALLCCCVPAACCLLPARLLVLRSPPRVRACFYVRFVLLALLASPAPFFYRPF